MTTTYDPAGTDKEHPAACVICKAPASRTNEQRPSGYGFKVICDNGHVTNGMPRELTFEEEVAQMAKVTDLITLPTGWTVEYGNTGGNVYCIEVYGPDVETDYFIIGDGSGIIEWCDRYGDRFDGMFDTNDQLDQLTWADPAEKIAESISHTMTRVIGGTL